MKMKNMLIGGMSLALVACLSVGATLAYLTDSAESVTNTFEFAGAGGVSALTVTLSEENPSANPGAQASVAANGTNGYAYSNVLPGDTLQKKPLITVSGSIDSYVFVRVTENGDVSVKDFNTAVWAPVTDSELEDNVSVYYYKGKNAPNGVISDSKVPVDLTSAGEELFTQVEIAEDATMESDSAGSVTIEIAAIQANSAFESAEEAYAELDPVNDWAPAV